MFPQKKKILGKKERKYGKPEFNKVLFLALVPQNLSFSEVEFEIQHFKEVKFNIKNILALYNL